MSTVSPSPLRPRFAITPTMRITLLAWLVVAIGGYVLLSINIDSTKEPRGHVNVNQPPKVPGDLATDTGAGSHKASTEPNHNRQPSGPDKVDVISDRGSVTQSGLAVRKANTARHAAIANAAVRDLGKLKNLQMEWAALEATVTSGQAGNRIAGSAKHFPMVVDIWQRKRPTAEQIVDWESELSSPPTCSSHRTPAACNSLISAVHGRQTGPPAALKATATTAATPPLSFKPALLRSAWPAISFLYRCCCLNCSL